MGQLNPTARNNTPVINFSSNLTHTTTFSGRYHTTTSCSTKYYPTGSNNYYVVVAMCNRTATNAIVLVESTSPATRNYS